MNTFLNSIGGAFTKVILIKEKSSLKHQGLIGQNTSQPITANQRLQIVNTEQNLVKLAQNHLILWILLQINKLVLMMN